MTKDEPGENFQLKQHTSAYRQIAELLREEILLGKIAPGSLLASTKELAKSWNSSYFTVHTALKLLVKEGLLDRVHGARTSVRHRASVLSCAGIYFGKDIWMGDVVFHRNVCRFLQDRLKGMGVRTEVFIDSRPKDQQGVILPSLQRAVELKEIQCLIMPLITPVEMKAMQKLSIPVAHLSVGGAPGTKVHFDMRQYWRGALLKLRAQKCQSVGVICSIDKKNLGDDWKLHRAAWNLLQEEIKAAGLTTQDQWLLGPDKVDWVFKEFGYHAFRKLWKEKEKPEGLIVYPDSIADGVILGALREGVKIPEQLKCVFHRNSHINLICPFPVTWGISDEEKVADDLIRIIQAQLMGKPVEINRLPFSFVKHRKV